MKLNKYAAALLIGSAMLSNAAFAVGTPVTSTVTATLNFDTPLTITPVSQINFGLLKAATAANYTIDTAGNVTSSVAGTILGGKPTAGNLMIAGSTLAGQVINVSLGSFTPSTNGVTLNTPMCSYGGAPAVACSTQLTGLAAPGAGTPLLLGVTAQVPSITASSTAETPSFIVTVNYN